MKCSICGGESFSRTHTPINHRKVIITLTCKKCESKHQYEVKDLGVYINA
jgi:transcription elongation factor Elf1